jgi:hypothetical protein
MQAAYGKVAVFTGALQALLLDGGRHSGTLQIPEGNSGLLAFNSLILMFQEIRDVMNNPTLEFNVMSQFPYRVIGGTTMAGCIQAFVTAVHEVW